MKVAVLGTGWAVGCAPNDQFEQIGLIPLAYNRAILLMAQAFHGTGETFGDSPETGRLSQHFEFSAQEGWGPGAVAPASSWIRPTRVGRA